MREGHKEAKNFDVLKHFHNHINPNNTWEWELHGNSSKRLTVPKELPSLQENLLKFSLFLYKSLQAKIQTHIS